MSPTWLFVAKENLQTLTSNYYGTPWLAGRLLKTSLFPLPDNSLFLDNSIHTSQICHTGVHCELGRN